MFIHEKNQKILWELINEVPLFSKQPLEEREHQFQTAIEKIYHENPEKINDKKHLTNLNKHTIHLLLLKILSFENKTNMVVPNTNIISQMHQSTPYQLYDSTQREQHPNSVTENQEKEYYQKPIVEQPTEKKIAEQYQNNIFEQRQKEYDAMMNKPPLPDVKFAEKTDDGPIKNIEELIEQQKKERENVFIHPPPPPSAASPHEASSKIYIEISPIKE